MNPMFIGARVIVRAAGGILASVAFGLPGLVHSYSESNDFAENNAAQWGTFASDSATTSVANSTLKLKDGSASLLFITASGFDTGLKYPASPTLDFNASSFNALSFWEYPENTTTYGWQGNQPVVRIQTNAGTITLESTTQQTSNFAWRRFKVPLAGGNGWTRTTTGTPDLAHVTQIEIHHDTWDFGFKIWLDGLRFFYLDPAALPPAGPPPPPGVDPDIIRAKVLLYVMDPIMENKGGSRMHQAYGWQDPVTLADGVRQDLLTSSHGRAVYEIVETVIADEHPLFQNGFQHTDATFSQDWEQSPPVIYGEGVVFFDYVTFCNAHNLGARVDAGEIDEVWIYAPPVSGLFESSMAGTSAYWINGIPYPSAGGQRAFAIMGLNFQRGVAEAIHSWGHRAESIMVHCYGPWEPNRNTTWNRFALRNSDAPGLGGVGNVHYPVNTVINYGYNDYTFVNSNADAWLSYPNLNNNTRSINCLEWSPSGAGSDFQLDYLKWWYSHMPHVPGRGPDFYLANWWRYLVDIDQFKNSNGNLYYTIGVPSVQVTYPAAASALAASRPAVLRSEASVDGALGRVDFYIDGVFKGTDYLAPYTLSWIPQSTELGNHAIVAKAYELQNGTETVSAPVNVTVIGILGITRISAGTLRFQWRGVPGALHRIESNPTLASGQWVTVATVAADGTGLLSHDVVISGGDPRGFFRMAYP